jgi:transcriptional regulator
MTRGAEWVTAILRLTGDLRAAWTDRQCEIVRIRRTTPLQKDVAERLGVSPSVVCEVLRAARHDAIQEAEEAARVILDRLIASGDGR